MAAAGDFGYIKPDALRIAASQGAQHFFRGGQRLYKIGEKVDATWSAVDQHGLLDERAKRSLIQSVSKSRAGHEFEASSKQFENAASEAANIKLATDDQSLADYLREAAIFGNRADAFSAFLRSNQPNDEIDSEYKIALLSLLEFEYVEIPSFLLSNVYNAYAKQISSVNDRFLLFKGIFGEKRCTLDAVRRKLFTVMSVFENAAQGGRILAIVLSKPNILGYSDERTGLKDISVK
ncbi:hypothetical protein [Roseibium album]|uniref:hypothetical protein n=1 Tax=Roseibium album TaxID=311410 RepID=UPI003299E4D9